MAEQALRTYNTLTRKKEPFVPLRQDRVRIYTCGVTPYAEAHLGHARPALIWSVIRKYLQRRGYEVTLVQNFTDVDDKIIDRAQALDEDPLTLARRFADKYMASMRALGIEDADHYPLVSEHIEEIVEMIAVLIEKDVAYTVEGNVFYDVTRFPEYGRLSGQRLDELLAGSRIEADERKRNPMDFALWKAVKPGEPAWDSPWGQGRPGWHIECSAMALKYLGHQIDFHGGGLDLVFPHHENEIAQSEAYTGGEPFVRFWVHNGLVNMDAEKMSKSIGNVVSVEALLKRYPASLLRFFLLSTHYRSPLEFSEQAMEEAQRGWRRLNEGVQQLRVVLETIGDPTASGPETDPQARAAVWNELRDALRDEARTYLRAMESSETQFDLAMSDDFNTARALAAMFDLVRATNAFGRRVQTESESLAPEDVTLLRGALCVFEELAGNLLGVLEEPAGRGSEPGRELGGETLVADLVQVLLDLRAKARSQKDWTVADDIRDRVQALGIALEDTPDGGTSWKIR